jgi:hypothetical protein
VRRLLRTLRAYLDDDRAGIVEWGCFPSVVKRFERTGKLPPIRDLDRALRPIFRRQCRLIERIDEALK